MTFPETLEAIDADNRRRRWHVFGAGVVLLGVLLVGGCIDGANNRDAEKMLPRDAPPALPCVMTP